MTTYLFSASDPQGRAVELTQACYTRHILVEHPALVDSDPMAALTIPEAVQAYFPHNIDPAQLWVNYNAKADALTIYFTGKPTPSVWDDVDEYAYIGFSLEDESIVTGLMIEHFSQWLLMPGHTQHQLQPA